MCTRKIWDHADTVDDFFDSCSFGLLWWPGIEMDKELSNIAVWRITGRPANFHEELLVQLISVE